MNHLILELYGIQQFSLGNIFDHVIEEIGATKLEEFGHNFGEEHAYTHVTMLAESHMSIHTWPESGYAAYDLFYCSKYDIQAVVKMLREHFQAERIIPKVIKRDPLGITQSLTTNEFKVA